MFNTIDRFAINADDVSRARRFYEKTFGWRFEPWGPPDFYLIHTDGVGGLLQGRRELVKGERMTGFECSIEVEDIDATLRTVTDNGGKVLMPKSYIPTVGHVAYFTDPEGNVAGAVQYEKPAK